MVFLYGLELPQDLPIEQLTELGIDEHQALALGGLVPLLTGVIVGSLLQGPKKPKTA